MVDLFGINVASEFIWIGILICILHSATFSGLNLAFFSLNRLQLEVLVADGDNAAQKVLSMRKDSNFLLTTILWGNVGINVLLTLLSERSLLALLGSWNQRVGVVSDLQMLSASAVADGPFLGRPVEVIRVRIA